MLTVTLFDLWFRRRQFLIAVAGAALLFALALLLSGMAAGFGVEITRSTDTAAAQYWVMAQGSSGKIAGMPPIDEGLAATVAHESGVRTAEPMIAVSADASVGPGVSSVILFGYRRVAADLPPLLSGRPATRDDEAVVDTRLGLGPGQRFSILAHRFRVVGTVGGETLLGGTPDVFVTLRAAQAAAYGGQALVTAVVTRGLPRRLPTGTVVLSTDDVIRRSLSQMASAANSITNLRYLMWAIAALIVAALVYVAALERTRDFAVMKALGSSSAKLFGSLATQAVIVALIAAGLAAVMANGLTGVFTEPVDIPGSAFVTLPVAALAIGLLSSLVAIRRAVTADPATAFAGS